jgi:putative photosynthetic complex assembly protein 2
MAALGLPVIATLALWWASTGVILYLDARPPRTYVWTLLGASGLLGLALLGLDRSSGMTTTGAAYEAFSCGLMIWAWQLVTFYTGYITGPRKTAIERECAGRRRFVEALRTSLYHELAALLGGVLVFAITSAKPNQIGLWTYVVLWWMHQSAKLNVFFGVPNLGEEMLPDHLRYLVSFMRRRPMNLFFPLSVTVSTVITVLLAQKTLAPTATPFEAAGFAMLTTLMVLAIAEHWFLVAPLHANALWSWSGAGREQPAIASSAGAPIPARAPRFGDDSDYPAPLAGSGAALESWSPDPPALCDARRLHHVLESIGTGVYGEVDCVRGVLKTSANWISFELAGRHASVSPFFPQRLQEPLVIALGRQCDRARLQAAFDACAAMT